MKKAIYKVCIGNKECGDNWDTKRVIAETALEAIKKVTLLKDEYIAEVHLIGRSD